MGSFSFSVVIPVFNSCLYVENCVNSLKRQTCKNFDVIFVDDASNDDSVNFIHSLFSDCDIRYELLLNDINRGPGYSRSVGLQVSKGDYICFIDSDDWIEDNYFFELNKKCNEKDFDIIFFNYNKVFNKKKTFYNCVKNLREGEMIKSNLAYCYDSLCMGSYKKKLFDNVNFPEIYNAEDTALVPIIVSNSNCIGIITIPLYNYIYRNNSLSTNKSLKVIESFTLAIDYIKSHIDPRYVEELQFKHINLHLYAITYKSIEANLSQKEILGSIQNFESENRCWFNNIYISKLNIRKKMFFLFVKYRQIRMLRMYVYIQKMIFSLLS